MDDELRVTVIATGFERHGMPRPLFERPTVTRSTQEVEVSAPSEAGRPAAKPAPSEFRPRTFNTEDLDIPTFLRKRGR